MTARPEGTSIEAVRRRELIMPPHCDSLAGPVVAAARTALARRDVTLVLPYVPQSGEAEVQRAFERTLRVRGESDEARELADLWFYETVVRIHRAGEGASYTGLKPAGLPHDPATDLAEEAVEKDSPTALANFLKAEVEREVERRLLHVEALRAMADGDLDASRKAVEAALAFELWVNSLHEQIRAESPAQHAALTS
jgi:hypothetical protein